MRAKILNASAGSGKTYQLAYKYVRDVVEQPSIYRHILAVTFTNKATEEMKSRILRRYTCWLRAAKAPTSKTSAANWTWTPPRCAGGPRRCVRKSCTTTRASRC
ncbi:MAG: UvrD-helicase domain-containing protein [Alistipes finegoldii]